MIHRIASIVWRSIPVVPIALVLLGVAFTPQVSAQPPGSDTMISPVTRSFTTGWPRQWNQNLEKAAAARVQKTGATPGASEPLVLVFLDRPGMRQRAESVLRASVADYQHARLVRATPAQLGELDALGISYQVQANPRRIGHQLLPFDSATETVVFPTAVPQSAGSHAGRKLYWVQFIGPIDDQWLKSVQQTGVRLLNYYPQFTYVVWASENEIDAARALPQVAWAGEFAPGFKLSHELAAPFLLGSETSLPAGPVQLTVCAVLADGAHQQIFAELAAAGATVELRTTLDIYESARVTINSDQISPLIARGGILSVEVYYAPQKEDEVSTQIAAGNYVSNVPSTGYQTWLGVVGLNGSGVTVGVVDDGVTDTHPDLSGRVVSLNYGGGTTGGGHGHHVAGIVAGNAAIGTTDANSFKYGQGMAPMAGIINQPYLKSGALRTYQQLCRDAVTTAGFNGVPAYVQNNSWGSGGGNAPGTNTTYQSGEREYDIYVRDADNLTAGNQSLVVCFSAGNDGILSAYYNCPVPSQSLTRPKSAKNIITTGATNNYRTAQGVLSNNIQELAYFSSRGPTNDLRIKPEIVMPGTYVASARTNSYVAWGAIDANYVFVGGTSQASPHTAGSAALLTQWWQNSHAGAKPSPAMVKALLITSSVDLNAAGDSLAFNINGSTQVCNSTESTSLAVPNQHEGWGRVSLNNILQSPVPIQNVDQTTTLESVGQTHVFSGTVADPSRGIRVTLSWLDAPASIGANPALVNNLDLEVTVAGTTYRGNFLTNGLSVAGGTADAINNTECVILPAGPSGPITVTVRATALPGDGVPGNADATDQDFALVITNASPVVNVAPTLSSAATLTGAFEDTPFTISYATLAAAADEADTNGDAIAFRVESVSSGTLTKNGVAVVAGTTLLSAGESWVWTAATNVNVSGVNAFTVKAWDGALASAIAVQVSANVGAVNDAPAFVKGSNQTVLEDAGAQTVTNWATALSAGPADEVAQVLNFIVSNNNNGLFATQPAIGATGTLTYTPAANANGTATVTVQIHDNGGTANGGVDTSVGQAFAIDVTSVADAPTISDIANQTINENTSTAALAIVLADVDTAAASLTLTGSSSNSTIVPNASIVFGGSGASRTVTVTPAANQFGTVTITVTVSDGVLTANDTFTVTINATQPHAVHVMNGAGYVAGGTVTISNTLVYIGAATSLGWHVLLPAGWSYAGGGGSEGDVKPTVGATSVLDWQWTTPPASPVMFTYTLNVPVGASGANLITALGSATQGPTPTQVLANPDPLVSNGSASSHRADTDGNNLISVIELTRVIELYNTRNGTTRTGAYAVATSATEDGFVPDPARAPGATAVLASYHSADTNQDGRITLIELTRVIELYNYRNGTTRTGQYHVQSGTEDGYAPGP